MKLIDQLMGKPVPPIPKGAKIRVVKSEDADIGGGYDLTGCALAKSEKLTALLRRDMFGKGWLSGRDISDLTGHDPDAITSCLLKRYRKGLLERRKNQKTGRFEYRFPGDES